MSEFFIHYRPLPARLRRFLLSLVACLIAITVILGIWGPDLHNQYGAGRRQPVRELSGWLLNGPGGAQLLVPRPGIADGIEPFNRVLLAGPGKTVPPASVMDHAGDYVKLQGSLFSHGPLDVMNTRRATPLTPPPGIPQPDRTGTFVGRFSLLGEIMDSKCFSGVMKPGAGTTHKGCAIRCISGGVPAVFHVRRDDGSMLEFVLIDPQGQTVNDRIVPRVAQPLRIEGDVVRFDNLLALRADPAEYQTASLNH
ncbi:MAG: hypothetical protein ACON4T_07740 [Synechococcus sp.]